jgi:hypothetical protein
MMYVKQRSPGIVWHVIWIGEMKIEQHDQRFIVPSGGGGSVDERVLRGRRRHHQEQMEKLFL